MLVDGELAHVSTDFEEHHPIEEQHIHFVDGVAPFNAVRVVMNGQPWPRHRFQAATTSRQTPGAEKEMSK